MLFLDSKDACVSENEAQQRAAVLALHEIAGNRALERTLPPPYVGLWKCLEERRAKKEERRQKDDERRRKERERKARALKKQGPATVIMTQGHRDMVEEVLRDVRASTGGGFRRENDSERMDDLISELGSLGFAEEDAQQAAWCCESLSSALDWLCLHITEDRLPSEFASGAAGKPVTVIRSVERGDDTEIVDPSLQELVHCGYEKDEAMAALENSRGDVRRAIISLFLGMCTQGSFGSEEAYQNSEPAKVNDALEEERMALEAIYGDMMKMNGSQEIQIRIQVPLQEETMERLSSMCAVDVGVEGVDVNVRFLLPSGSRNNEAMIYPDMSPIVSVYCAGLPGPCIQKVTRMAASHVSDLVGQPVIYEAVSHVSEHLPEAIASYMSESRSGSALVPRIVSDQAEGNVSRQGQDGKHIRVKSSKRRTLALARDEIVHENKRLLKWQQELNTNPRHAGMKQVRENLPAATKRQSVLDSIERNEVTIIMGSTGCGKSTQVPQFILENEIAKEKGGSCNIICTQPRRISAIGLASRVSQERGEQKVGSSVGYSVRLDSKVSKQTRLLFCTTGVMLRRLLADPGLESVTHIVLDEVHERTIESDLLLFLLRDLLLSKKNKKLKVILMSATAEAELFAGYFKGIDSPAPIISIPGFTHPVQDFFLDDIFERTGYEIGKSSKWARKDAKSIDVDEPEKSEYSPSTIKSLSLVDETNINTELIEILVAHIIREDIKNKSGNSLGAILIFVPGAALINRLVKGLQTSSSIAGQGFQLRVLPLHGGLPPSQQSKVFERPPSGVTKVVVATNVAETSITIDDVTCVIDSGKANEVRFDPVKGISRLQEVFVSQASCQQRRGRAGRVQPGVCYRLFSKKNWSKMEKNTLPEISRSSLHALVMDTKAITSGDVFETLHQMLTPPPMDGLQQAVTSLVRMGALDATNQSLTPLGKHLTRMPCDPKLGKMLIYGAILRCLDPVLTIVAAQAFGKPVFWSTPDKREEALQAKKSILGKNISSKSDHIAIIGAYNGWRHVLAASGRKYAAMYAAENFVSDQAMESIHSGRRQYAEILVELGFIPQSYPSVACRAEYTPPGLTKNNDVTTTFSEYGGVDEYAAHGRVVKAALSSGFYPQILRVQNPAAQFQKIQGGAIETEGSGGRVKLFDREKGRVFIHPSSVNFSAGKFESGWLVYSDIMETSKIFIRECSMVPVYAVLLFGGHITVQHEKGMILVDDWASFKAPARIGVLVRELRAELARLLAQKIEDPQTDMSQSKLIDAMHQLLSSDGF